MGIPKEGGDKPGNSGLSDFKVLPEQRGVGPHVQKSVEPNQQPADPELDAAKQLLGKRWGKTVFENPIRVRRPLPRNTSEQGREAQPFEPNLKEQQAREQLGKPPPQGVKEEVQPEPAPIHQEHPVDSLDEFRQLARQVLIPPVSPEQLERAKPENAANYAAAMRRFDEAVEALE